MGFRGLLWVCLAMVVITNASATSDASLNSYISEYSIDQFIGGASFIDSCNLSISPFKIRGNVKPIYIPSGTEKNVGSLYTSSENQLDFNLQRHGSPDTWSMTISLPNCHGTTKQTLGSHSVQPQISKVGVWCHRCGTLENAMLAIGAIAITPQELALLPTSEGNGTVMLVIEDNGIRLPESHRQRSLLQTEADCATYPCPGCSGPLAVGSTSIPFDNCISLGLELQLFYTLVPSGSKTTTFKGGLWAKNSEMYSSFGFSPDGTGAMIGANAVIVYPDTASKTGASVTGITLNSYLVSELNAAKGSYPLSDTAATKNPDGSLSATFSVELDSSIEKLKSDSIVYIYVINGPMLPGNVLGDHKKSLRGSVFGADILMIDTSIISNGVGDSGTNNSSSVPEAAPVVETDEEKLEEEEEEENEKIGDDDLEVASPTIPPAITTPTTTPSPSPSSSTSASTAACSVTIAGEERSYEACYPVQVGSNFQVYYSFESDPLDSKSSILSMAMQATSTGYVSVGFPSRPGRMTNAGAAILQACSSCPTGASIKEYYMSGTDNSDVLTDNRMNMSDFKASAADGVIYGSWKMKLPGTAAPSTGRRRRRRLFQASAAFPASAYPLIYAAGPITSSGALISHTAANDASGYLDLLNGLPGGGGEIPTVISQSSSLQDAHMWLATISWGVLIPMAIIMARYFKPHTGKWFAIHRAVAILGFILAIVALILGFQANNGWETNKPVHRDLGISCTVLGLVQMFAVINKLRPAKDHKYRQIWFFGHAWIGRTAVILAIANIYYGIINVAELGTWAWAAYTAVLGCIVALGLVMEVINWRLRKNLGGSSQNILEVGGKNAKNTGERVYGGDMAYSNGVSTEDTSQHESRRLTELELN